MCNKLCITLLAMIAVVALLGPAAAEIDIWAAGSTEKIRHGNRARLPHDRVWDAPTPATAATITPYKTARQSQVSCSIVHNPRGYNT